MVNSKIISHAKQNFGASPKIIDNARELRRNMTEAEKILWRYLRKNQLRGMHFR
jgi:very-short-patch-repair endonuclease